MIELRNDKLDFRFPEVHEDASCSIDFKRTLRIPDDNNPYPLPPGLGQFPVMHIDDYASKLPDDWVSHGGVFIPMYQSEALWINFHGYYPCAVKVAAGKINAVDGSSWTKELSTSDQDYAVITKQPWLDGFNVSEGYIRQFVAMPLGEGYTAEEQITGKAEHGGLQVIVYPMKRGHYEEMVKKKPKAVSVSSCDEYFDIPAFRRQESMGLAPGGLMRQKIYDDPHGVDVWDQENGVRCFIHIVNSAVYTDITGTAPPHKSPTAKEYNSAGLPWFEYYSDATPVGGSKILGRLTSLGAKVLQKTGEPFQDNQSVTPVKVKHLGTSNGVRQGNF
jgi:hypothetical protein